MSETNVAWSGSSWPVDRLVKDSSMNARCELARRLRAAETEAARLRMRCEIRERTAARWAEAAQREVPTPAALERAREQFVECRIRQEEAPPGSIMRRVCDAAMDLFAMLDQRDDTMKARVVALSLELDRLRTASPRLEEAPGRIDITKLPGRPQ